jgi:RNA polymerase sigma-70 factor (ECF subfamily)
MSYAEVSDSLDIATKTVENQMGRALKTLRERLEEYSATVA